MAGVFGLGNFTKPGKGVNKDEKPKNPFVMYFIIMGRKFFRLIELNIVYALIVLPVFSFFAAMLYSTLYSLGYGESGQVSGLPGLVLAALNYLPPALMYLIIGLSALAFGPCTAGMSYVVRNYSQEQHSWPISDMFEHARKNLGQGLFFGIFDLATAYLMLLYLQYQPGDEVSGIGEYAVAFRTVAIILYVVYLVMRFYIYPMMVTAKLPLWNLFKNSLMFFFLGFARNLLALIIDAALILLSMAYSVVVMPFITFAWLAYSSTFWTFPVIKKYIVDPQKAFDDEEEEAPAEDDGYVPTNGYVQPTADSELHAALNERAEHNMSAVDKEEKPAGEDPEPPADGV